MGVPAFRKACHNALVVDGDLGRSIGSLAEIFRPTTSRHDPFLKDFARTVLQGFNVAGLPDEWEANTDFTTGLFALPAPATPQSMPQHASDGPNEPQEDDDDFEDIDDVLNDVDDANVEGPDLAFPIDGGFESPITIEDDEDYEFIEHTMVVGQRSHPRNTDPSSAISEPRSQARLREPTPQTPLAYRRRVSSISLDEATVSLPPSPYDTIRSQMRIAAQQASPTPAPRALPTVMEDLEESAMPGSAAQMPIPWIDREAAMQQMVSVIPLAERERWTLAFDMYVRGLVMDVVNEARNI